MFSWNTGNERMLTLRNTILASLNSDTPDYSGIRENIGQYLHLLQSFYSNTIWVELYPEEINSDLGKVFLFVSHFFKKNITFSRTCFLNSQH